MKIQNHKLYKTRNGLEVLIESEEAVCSPMPWDFTGRDTKLKKYLHYRTNGTAHEGEEYDIIESKESEE